MILLPTPFRAFGDHRDPFFHLRPIGPLVESVVVRGTTYSFFPSISNRYTQNDNMFTSAMFTVRSKYKYINHTVPTYHVTRDKIISEIMMQSLM